MKHYSLFNSNELGLVFGSCDKNQVKIVGIVVEDKSIAETQIDHYLATQDFSNFENIIYNSVIKNSLNMNPE